MAGQIIDQYMGSKANTELLEIDRDWEQSRNKKKRAELAKKKCPGWRKAT